MAFFFQQGVVIDGLRAILFMALLFLVFLSIFINGGVPSVPALLVFLGMYATLLFRVDVDRYTLLRCLRPFQTGMTVIAFVVLGQQVVQYTIGNSFWPNLDSILPKYFLVGGYAYLRPYAWKSPYLVPNGVFFLEPSAVSGYLAIAFATEVVWFRRASRLCIFGSALLAGMAGTGIAMLVLGAPLLLCTMDRRIAKFGLALGVPLLIGALVAGAFSHQFGRLAEFSTPQSSAFGRITVPFEATIKFFGDPDYLVSGNGPGAATRGIASIEWPITKLLYEYGLLVAIAFHVFLSIAILWRPASRVVALIVLLPYLFFGGGFVTHTNIMMLVMFGSLLRPQRGEAPHCATLLAKRAEREIRIRSYTNGSLDYHCHP